MPLSPIVVAILFCVCFTDVSAQGGDSCATATLLPATDNIVGVSDDFSTQDPSGVELVADSCGSGRAVFYRYVASVTGLHRFETCGSSFNTMLARFAFSSCAAITECNDDSCGQGSSMTRDLIPGQTLYFRIAGFNNETGNGTIRVQYTSTTTTTMTSTSRSTSTSTTQTTRTTQTSTTRTTTLRTTTPAATFGPSTCGSARIISSTSQTLSFDIANAPLELGIFGCGAGGRAVWFYVSPSQSGSWTFSLCSASQPLLGQQSRVNFDSVLEVFRIDALQTCDQTLSSISCNDNTCGSGSEVTTTLSSRNVYAVRISSKGTVNVGSGDLRVLFLPAPTSNPVPVPIIAIIIPVMIGVLAIAAIVTLLCLKHRGVISFGPKSRNVPLQSMYSQATPPMTETLDHSHLPETLDYSQNSQAPQPYPGFAPPPHYPPPHYPQSYPGLAPPPPNLVAMQSTTTY